MADDSGLPSVPTLILYILVFIVGAVITIYLFIGTLTGKADFIRGRFTTVGRLVLRGGSQAIDDARNLIGTAFDTTTQTVDYLNRVLQAYAGAFAQTIETFGQTLADAIATVLYFVQGQNEMLTVYINGFFDGIVDPIFDTIGNFTDTIVAVANALIGTFNPNNCPSFTEI